MELYLLGAARDVTAETAETLKATLSAFYVTRKLTTGLYDVIRLGDRPLYNGQFPFTLGKNDKVETW